MLQSNQTITFDGTYANDTIPPQAEPENFLAPVSINYGESATADTSVDIVLAFVDEVAGLGPGAQMVFSNDGVSWSSPESYSTLKKDWDLTQFGGNSTQGMKTVYVKVSDAFGNWTAPLTDTILYVPNRQVLEVPEAYSAIQDALNAAVAGDIVHVLPGSYNPGTITIPQGVRLQGSGPALTTLIASTISMNSDTMIDGFTIKTWSSIACYNHISGVIISNNVFNTGGYAIEIGSGSRVIVRNNVIDNFSSGILLLDSGTSAIIENNTVVNNSNQGIQLSNAQPDTKVYVYNNILANNPGYAITDGNTPDTEHKHIFSQFNTFWNNTQGDFGGVNSDKITGAGDINIDPMFVDLVNGDYGLLPGSPCINSGYPEDRYDDRDDTRNDRGAYGGPCLNTPPHAEFLIDPTLIGMNTPFSLDASFSSDSETETANLLVRWDFDGDAIYDTSFTTNKTETYQYGSLGAHTIGLQIKDGNGSVASTTSQVTVANSSPNTPGNPTPPDGSLDQGINVTLSWQGGDPDSGDTVTYDVYFGTSSNPPLVSSGQTGTTYNPGTLNYLTFSYWKIVATDNHGASSLSPVWSFVTQVEPVSQAPTNLSANPVSSSQVDLTWTDISTNEIGFKIERKIGVSGTWSQIYVVGASTSNYSDTGLNSNTTYYYRVRAYNISGNSGYSNETNAHTPAAPEINVKQGGTDIPSGGNYNFGTVNVGSSTTVSFTIQNIGTANLNLTGNPKAAISGANAGDFSVTTQPTSPIAPSGSTTFTLRFAPTATGTRTATVSMANNDSNENPYTFTVTGTGTCGIPAAATLQAPSGTITTSRPTYTWNAVTCATWYYLWVNGPSGNVIKQWYTAAQANCASETGTCAVTPSTTLANGNHTWWIQTWNSAGYGPWSSGLSFTVSAPPPATTLVAPSGTSCDATPTYIWNAVSSATWYYLWVNGPSGNVVKQWYTAAQAHCASGTGTCAVAPATTLASGSSIWWIQTWNSVGYGPWSAGKRFTVTPGSVPGAVTLISPTGTTTNPPPYYWWYEDSCATWYYLWVNGPSGTPVIKKWYTAAQAQCTGTWCWVTNVTTLPAGTNTWWVQTWNSAGYGPWSAGMGFTVSASAEALAPITIRKSETGTGTIFIGAQACGPACVEVTVPYVAGARYTVQVVPAADSRFVQWETADGVPLASIYYAQPGETVIAVFEKK
jgi:hypothetical protein